MYIYFTNFYLSAEVHPNKFEEAQTYLSKDDMTKYLKQRLINRLTKESSNKIEHVEWILSSDRRSGRIEVKTNDILTESEKTFISNWIKGQNSDGIGEGFENRNFASGYDSRRCRRSEDDELEDDEYDGCKYEFDWETNDYLLQLDE